MRKIVCLSLVFVFCIFFCNSYVFADEVECEYESSVGNYSIIYDDTDSPRIRRNDLIDLFEFNSWGLFEIRNRNNTDENLNTDQDYNVAVYGIERCPTNMRVCRFISFKVGAQTVISQMVSLISSGELADSSVFELTNDLYFYNEQSYNDSSIKRYEDTYICSVGDGGQAIENITEWCESATGNIDFSDVLCGIGANAFINSNMYVSLIASGLEAAKDGIDFARCSTLICTTQSYTGEYDTFDANCGTLENLKTSFINSINEYKSCGNDKNCKMNKSRDLDVIETRAKSYCGSVVKNYSYDELQSGCLNACFSLKKDLNDLKKNTDLFHGITSNSGTCSVSDKIINWLSNIFRWGKFIAPALVIIMSMLDFIKAIASQSEDEMKKVQGKFVNRLIAAALVFLLPFILEFILRAFNLLSDNPYCGLI